MLTAPRKIITTIDANAMCLC